MLQRRHYISIISGNSTRENDYGDPRLIDSTNISFAKKLPLSQVDRSKVTKPKSGHYIVGEVVGNGRHAERESHHGHKYRLRLQGSGSSVGLE